MNYRSRPLLDLAHRIDVCMCCLEPAPDGCEPAHSNQSRHGKGMSIKAHDLFHAAIKHDCHAKLDQGKHLSREERTELWQIAHERTLLEYFRRGWLKVTK